MAGPSHYRHAALLSWRERQSARPVIRQNFRAYLLPTRLHPPTRAMLLGPSFGEIHPERPDNNNRAAISWARGVRAGREGINIGGTGGKDARQSQRPQRQFSGNSARHYLLAPSATEMERWGALGGRRCLRFFSSVYKENARCLSFTAPYRYSRQREIVRGQPRARPCFRCSEDKGGDPAL